ncbi:MAG: Fe-S cluster assembly ATPase SufC [Nanoarchaeota archaeon]
MLEVKDLHVTVEGNEILKGINLIAKDNEITVLMGPNGSGKSTLANTLMGHPKFEIAKGEINFNDILLNELSPEKRAKLGLFLSFQYPQEIPGVSVRNFLRTAYNSVKGTKLSPIEFRKIIEEKMNLLKVDKSFADRYLNEGFSGGEKKRSEILQLAVLEPKFAILDETDSGLDIDSLKTVAEGVNKIKKKIKNGVLIITHYKRILDYIKPDKVYIVKNGKIVEEGNIELVEKLEKEGYDWLDEVNEQLQV